VTQLQKSNLQRAAWRNRPDLEAVILKEIADQEFYKHHDFTPIEYGHVPSIVWWFIAAVLLAVWVILAAHS